jgi:hypothetical protein
MLPDHHANKVAVIVVLRKSALVVVLLFVCRDFTGFGDVAQKVYRK